MKIQQPSYGELKSKMRDEALAEQTGKFYEMAPKSSDVWGPVSAAPSQTVTGAAQGASFSGSGGYEYGQLPDGAFVILKSGRGAAPGTVVKPGMKGYNEIKNEFEMVKAGKPIPEKPRSASAPKPAATKPAPKAAAPKSEAPKPRGSTSTETPDKIADRLLTSLDGVPRGEPAPQFGGMGEVRRSENEAVPAPKYAPPASMVGPSESDKRKELAQFSNSIPGNIKRAGLMDDARRGLMGTGLNREGADRTVTQLASQMSKGNYDSYLALKAFAAL